MGQGHGARHNRASSFGKATPHNNVMSLSKPVHVPLNRGPVITIVGIPHNDVFSTGGLNSLHQRTPVPPLRYLHHPRAAAFRCFFGAIGAAIVRDQHFAAEAVFFQGAQSLSNTDLNRLLLVQTRHEQRELNRYLNAEKRGLIQVVENLWDKYAVPSRELEGERAETLKALDGYLSGLGYLK